MARFEKRWNHVAPDTQSRDQREAIRADAERAILVGLFGMVCVIQPFFPMDPGAVALAWQNVIHGAVFVISGVALIPGLLVLSVAFVRDPSLRFYRWYTLITPFVILLAGVDVGFFPAGVPERLSTLVILIWFEVVAFRLLWLTFHRDPGPNDPSSG